MRTYLANIDWNNLLKNKTATKYWICLKDKIEGITGIFVPLRKQEKCPGRNTCQKRLLENCSQADAVGVYKHIGNVEDYTNYKEALSLATTEIRKSKRALENKFAGNIKKITTRVSMLMQGVNRKLEIKSDHWKTTVET